MAEPRKSAKQTDARRRAREKAAQFRELQDTLEQLATDYFVAVDSVDETNEEAEREIAKIRKRAEQQTLKARDVADEVIVRMVAAGASAAEVAARLGVTSREVKKATKGTPSPVPADVPPALSVGDERGEETGGSPGEDE
jgi:DNA-directed RNA polymerase specialized sigma24 family protein